MKKTIMIVLLVYLLFSSSIPTQAQVPDKENALVYAVSVYDGRVHRGVFLPPSENTLYIISQQDNILVPRRTQVYYWPITREYKADWSSVNEPVGSKIEVYQDNRMVASIEREDFLFEYPDSFLVEKNILYSGMDAIERDRQHQAEVEKYYQALDAYFKSNLEYVAAYDLYMEKVRNSEHAVAPVAPVEPQFPSRQISELEQGFVLNLPEGSYTLRLLDEAGNFIPESERSVVVFSPRRTSISYKIIPASKWTRPETSHTIQDIIYGNGQTTLYLQLYETWEYNDLYYERMINPQSNAGREDGWRWVTGLEPIKTGHLLAYFDDRTTQLEYRPYKVQQTEGYSLGYNIVEVDSNHLEAQPPSFWAYRLDVDLSQQGNTIQWVDSVGREHKSSLRELRPLQTENGTLLYLVAISPLLFGGVVITWRKRSTQKQ